MADFSERDWLAFLAEKGASSPVGDGGIPARFGDPAGEYEAARDAVGLVPRQDRTLLRVHGRAPRQMLQGILTSSVSDPPPPGGRSPAPFRYGAILTPKGRMVTDLRQGWLGPDEEAGVALDVPRIGAPATVDMFAKVLPPRFARYASLQDSTGAVSVAGSGAREAVERVFGLLDDVGYALLDGGPLEGGVLVAAGIEQPLSWDVWAPWGSLPGIWDDLASGGARSVGGEAWETLRIEEGRPRFGQDMDESTIPLEAGLEDRAFDHVKGCYTGQEVIVRIRHRGHVNRHLRFLRFENGGSVGDELFAGGGGAEGKVLGKVTSVADSPRFGGRIGLGYVRREVDVPGELWTGGDPAARVRVEALGVSPP